MEHELTPEERARIGPEDARKAVTYLKSESLKKHWPRLNECAEILDEMATRLLKYEAEQPVEEPSTLTFPQPAPRHPCADKQHAPALKTVGTTYVRYCMNCGETLV